MDFQPHKYHVISIDWIKFLLGAVQSFQHFQGRTKKRTTGGEGGRRSRTTLKGVYKNVDFYSAESERKKNKIYTKNSFNLEKAFYTTK